MLKTGSKFWWLKRIKCASKGNPLVRKGAWLDGSDEWSMCSGRTERGNGADLQGGRRVLDDLRTPKRVHIVAVCHQNFFMF